MTITMKYFWLAPHCLFGFLLRRGCRVFPCGAWTLQLWHTGLLALRHVGSKFPDQGLNLSALNGRRILPHWTAREVPALPVLIASARRRVLGLGRISPPALFFCLSLVLAFLGFSRPVLVNFRFSLSIPVKRLDRNLMRLN